MLKKFGCPADANVHRATTLDMPDEINTTGQMNAEKEKSEQDS